MDIKIIKAPSPITTAILKNRSGMKWPEDLRPHAIGLVQGKLIEMVVAADVAEKCVGVFVSDIRGSCPQNMIMLMIAGETAAVREALLRIQDLNESEYIC